MDDKNDKTSGNNGTTWRYAYDLGGNIQSKQRFAYTTPGTEPTGTPLEETTFAYGQANRNLFGYCDNNPVHRTDKDGDFWIIVIDLV